MYFYFLKKKVFFKIYIIQNTFLKKYLFIILFFLIVQPSFEQSGIFFQAIARDNNLNPAKDRKIFVQSNIIQSSVSGTKILIEEHQTNTDAFGIFSIMVGAGLRVGGMAPNLASIDWSQGPYYLNLKIAITPIGAGITWDYTKEWIDIGTTIFGTVPYALFSSNTAKMDEKLNTTDTSKMLSVYAKTIQVKNLALEVDTKLPLCDTILFSKKTYTDSALLSKLNQAEINKFTLKSYTDSALLTKLNQVEIDKYVLKSYSDSVFNTKMNYYDTSKYAKQFYVDIGLSTKLNSEDSIRYTKKTYTDSALNKKLNQVEIEKYTLKTYSDSALLTKLSLNGNAATASFASTSTIANTALLAGNITATTNVTLTHLPNLNTVGIISSGVWSATTIDIAHGGTGLNTAGKTGQVLSTAGDGTLTWISLTSSTPIHYVGESFGGGKVFYVYDNGKHGLIAATSNLSYNKSYTFKWGPSPNYVMALRNGINAGIYNTERIIMQQGAGNGTYAAMVAAHYSFNDNGWGGYGDWYLPSKYELSLLYQQKNIVGGFDSGWIFWSSTEADDKTAWTLDFVSGTQQVESKILTTRFVRAIRAF